MVNFINTGTFMFHMVQKWFNIDYEIIWLLQKKEYHVRALAKELKIPHTTIIRKLKQLYDLNVIDFKFDGKNKNYFLLRNLFSQRMLFNTENYEFIKLLRKYPLLSPILKQVIKECPCKIILLFGSYAKGLAKDDSDIDIFIETENIQIKRSIENINSKLSVKIGKFNKDDILMQEIIKSHVVLKGLEEYYERLGFSI